MMNKNSKITLPVVLAMVLIIVALVYGLLIRPNFYRFQGGVIEFEAIQVERLNTGIDEQVLKMGDFLYHASKEGITKYDQTGESIWNKSYHFSNLLFLMEGDYMAVVDLSGKQAFVLDEEGVLGQITTEYQIITGTLSERGYLSLVQEDGQDNYIMMYDLDGGLIIERKTLFKEHGYPVAVALSDDGTRMLTAHLDVSKHMVESVITFLDFSTAGKEFEDRVIGHERLSEVMAADLLFLSEDQVVVVGDTELDFYSIGQAPSLVNRVSVSAEISHVAVAGSSLVVSYGEALLPEGQKLAGSVVVYDDMGVQQEQHLMDKDVTGLLGDEGTYYVIQSSKITCYRNGGKLWETVVYKPVDAIYHINSDRYLLVFERDYEVVAIRDI